jgi:hypothetical protein
MLKRPNSYVRRRPEQRRFSTLVLKCVLATIAISLSPSEAAQDNVTLFSQPLDAEIAGNFCVRCHFPVGHFNLVQWESNPNTADGRDVPTSWDLSVKTGFRPKGDLRHAQVAFIDRLGSSGAQMQGGTVGAYLDSQDFPNGAPSSKFIITPNITFSPQTKLFRSGEPTRIIVSFDLQVPTAEDHGLAKSAAYVVSDLKFTDISSGISLYVNDAVFRNRPRDKSDFVFFDPDTKIAVAFGNGDGLSRFSDLSDHSAYLQVEPWVGWRHFSYSIGQENFRAALDAVAWKYPNFRLSKRPEDWSLTEWHLNAEILFDAAPAKLGWSMRKAAIGLVQH